MTRKVLENAFNRMAGRLRLDPASAKYKALRAAYYHGAMVAYDTIINGLDPGDDLTGNDVALLNGLADELSAFQTEMLGGRAEKPAQPSVKERFDAMMKGAHTLKGTCPFCGNVNDTVVCPVPGHEGAKPKAGDLTMCVACGEWCVFGEDTTALRKPTDAEYERIAADPVARTTRNAWVEAQETIRRQKGEQGSEETAAQ